VARYNVLDTPPDGAFDRVAALAARLLDTPAASVTIVDTDRIWFKATHGLDGVTQVDRQPGLCSSAIRRDDALVIPDVLADPMARTNPLVTRSTSIRFYAAAPITTSDGYRLGTVNVLDTRPRRITRAETATLADLASLVMDQLELRLSALGAVRAERQQLDRERLRTQAESRRAQGEQRAREQAERDMAAVNSFAATLQRTLLPPALPAVPGLELASHYHTASPADVGGDFYDVVPLTDGRWAFFLGDVCGKGAEAAAVTSLARYTLRAAAHHEPDPRHVLHLLNTALLLDPSIGSRFCTAIFGFLTPADDGAFDLCLATGGHPPAYHLRPAERQEHPRVEAVHPEGGMLIGALEKARFTSRTLRLAPGETLLLYTDGLTEIRTADGAMLGQERLADFLGQCATPVSAASLVDDIAAMIHGLSNGVRDDIALLALSAPVAAPEGTSTTAHTAAAPEK
jgi:sigma-B regulation protein RsbU (phosphoserine phosphatase)